MSPDGPPAGRPAAARIPIRAEVTGDVAVEAEAGEPGEAVDAASSSPYRDQVEIAFGRLFRRYRDELAGASLGQGVSAPRFARVRVDLGRVVADVEFGPTLFRVLLDLYVVHGWVAIRAVSRAIGQARRAPASGVAVPDPAVSFFRDTRELLGGLIKLTLVDLERLAVRSTIPDLSRTAVAVEEAWTVRYAFTSHYDEDADERRYVMGRRRDEVHTRLGEVVAARVHYERAVVETARFRRDAEYVRRLARRRPGTQSTVEDVGAREREVSALEDRAAQLLEGMRAVLGATDVFPLLLLPTLEPGFTAGDMAHRLGELLTVLHGRLDALGTTLDPQRSRLGERWHVAGGDGHVRVDPLREVEVERGPEWNVADYALRHVAGDPGWAPLADPAILDRLLRTEDVHRGGLRFVVLRCLLRALTEELEARRAHAARSERFWSDYAKVASATSLIALVVPPAAPLAAVAGLVMMLHSVFAVVENLDRLDELRDRELLGPAIVSVRGIGRLGELGALGDRLLAELSQQLLIELAVVAVGETWPVVKSLLQARGYLQDVETMLGPSP